MFSKKTGQRSAIPRKLGIMKLDVFDTVLLKQAFATFPSGVTVVTIMAQDKPMGFTASSFTSVSIEPPMLLFCIDKASVNLAHYQEAASFAVNVLSTEQRKVAERFASDIDNRFENIDWRPSPLGNPLITDSASQFDCRTDSVSSAGDHLIITGIIDTLALGDVSSLGYYRGQYHDRLAQ